MRTHGQCVKCHKFKWIRVPASLLWKLSMGGIPEGICDDCEEAQRGK